MSRSLPNLGGDESSLILRRMEHCAREREGAGVLEALNGAHRAGVKQKLKAERDQLLLNVQQERVARIDRWTQKTQSSPFAVDQWKEDVKAFNKAQEAQKRERERRLLGERRKREMSAHALQQTQTYTEHDEMAEYREEKRKLLQNQKQLKALLDLEKASARAAKVLDTRKKQDIFLQSRQLKQAMANQTA